MFRDSVGKDITPKQKSLAVLRVTALWGFSEAALGGVLHAFKIPFTGLVVGASAVIFISLIAYFSDNKKDIIKSTFIVMLVKGIVSPHTPLTAYLAVFIQGGAGFILFRYLRSHKAAAFVLGVWALTYSAFQKLFILTLLFGNTLWRSFDQFIEYIFNQFSISQPESSFSASTFLILLYSGIHILGGAAAGIAAGRIPEVIQKKRNEFTLPEKFSGGNYEIDAPKRGRRKKWWKRTSSILIVFLAAAVLILSYIPGGIEKSRGTDIIVMLLRSVLILFLWFKIIMPPVKKLLLAFMNKQKLSYGKEVEEIISMFPNIGALVKHTWRESADLRGIGRIKHFVTCALVLILFDETE